MQFVTFIWSFYVFLSRFFPFCHVFVLFCFVCFTSRTSHCFFFFMLHAQVSWGLVRLRAGSWSVQIPRGFTLFTCCKVSWDLVWLRAGSWSLQVPRGFPFLAWRWPARENIHGGFKYDNISATATRVQCNGTGQLLFLLLLLLIVGFLQNECPRLSCLAPASFQNCWAFNYELKDEIVLKSFGFKIWMPSGRQDNSFSPISRERLISTWFTLTNSHESSDIECICWCSRDSSSPKLYSERQ